jgi:hypothetical protein
VKKAGFYSQEESQGVNSFFTVIPIMFNPTLSKRELCLAIMSFGDFDSVGGTSGFIKYLKEVRNLLEQQEADKHDWSLLPRRFHASPSSSDSWFPSNFGRNSTTWVTKCL